LVLEKLAFELLPERFDAQIGPELPLTCIDWPERMNPGGVVQLPPASSDDVTPFALSS